MARRGGWLLVAAALATAGCTRTEGRVVADLAASLGQARVRHETAVLDIGSREARAHLLEGWGTDETAADGTRFAWGLGQRSRLSVDLLVPRALTLALRGWPFVPAGSLAQRVSVLFNQTPVDEILLQPGPAAYQVRVPAHVTRTGSNEIELRYASARAPREAVAGATDARPLAVGWDQLAILEAVPPHPPVAEGRTLQLSHGTSVEYMIQAVPGSRLEVGGISGPAGLGLRVLARSATSEVEERFDVPASSRALALPASEQGWIALRLEAVWKSGRPAPEARLQIEEPVITAPGGDAPAPREQPRRPRPWNVVLYVIDTLRADRLGCYGHTGALSPRIDGFARDALLFERMSAASSWTRTSMASILTGLTPRQHGTHGRDAALPDAVTTLAERLAAAGWRTAGLVTNPNLAPEFGFDQGFESYSLLDEADPARGYVRSDALNVAAVTWLDARPRDAPFFLYLHSMDPHDPYFETEADEPRRSGDGPGVGSVAFMGALELGQIDSTEAVRKQLLSMYEAEIRFNDASFGDLLDRLEERDLDEDTLVVLTSDHGEEFFDHGWWRHGKTLYEEQLHVPWLIRLPGRAQAGRREAALARHADLFPTLLDALGLPAETGLLGQSRWPDPGRHLDRPDVAAAELDLEGRRIESLRLGEWKLIRHVATDRDVPPLVLFRLDQDRSELDDRVAEVPTRVAWLQTLLGHPRFVGSPVTEPRTVKIDATLRERLRAVGYLH